MWKTIKQNNADCITFKSIWVREHAHYHGEQSLQKFKAISIFNKDEIMCNFYGERLGFGASNKLFRRSILEKMDDYPNVFDKTITYGEDTDFCSRYLLLTNHVCKTNFKIHFYRQRKGGAVHSKFNESKLSLFKGLENALKYDSVVYQDALNYIRCRTSQVSLEFLFKIDVKTFSNKEIIKKLYKTYRENLKYMHKCTLSPWYLKGNFNYMFIPYFRFKFRKFLK